MAKPPGVKKIGFWHMVRDVLIASLNKGQFLVALLGMMIMLMIVKMPAADVSRLMFEVVGKLESGYLAGYLLSIILGGGWFAHAKFQRRIIQNELNRIAEQRTELQRKQLGKVKSSKK